MNPELFALTGKPKQVRQTFADQPQRRQAVLFCGLDDSPGQENLFPTDGPPAPPETTADRHEMALRQALYVQQQQDFWLRTYSAPKMRALLLKHGWRPIYAGATTYRHSQHWGFLEIKPHKEGWYHWSDQDVFGSSNASELPYHDSLRQYLAQLDGH